MGYIFNSDGILKITIEFMFINNNCLLRCIVNRCAVNFVFGRLCCSRSCQSVRQFMLFDRYKVSIKNYFFTTIVQIIILGRDFINFDIMEYCDNSHASSNNSILGYFSICAFDYPFIKNLSCNKRILRHCANGLTLCAKVLR